MKKLLTLLLIICLCICTSTFVSSMIVSTEIVNENFSTPKANDFECATLEMTEKIPACAKNSNTTYIVSANSAVVFASADFSSEKLATLNHKTEIVILTNDDEPVTEFWNEYKFFKIKLSENKIESTQEFGYIFADLLAKKQEEVVALPNFNARTNKECHVFIEESGKFLESEILLAKGQEIFLYEGFDAKKDFIAISYVNDGKVLYGFLNKDDISPNGLNPVLITCLILIVAVLSIIFAWLFIKGKHVHLKKQKPGKYDLNKNK